jgi:hypothetical protein
MVATARASTYHTHTVFRAPVSECDSPSRSAGPYPPVGTLRKRRGRLRERTGTGAKRSRVSACAGRLGVCAQRLAAYGLPWLCIRRLLEQEQTWEDIGSVVSPRLRAVTCRPGRFVRKSLLRLGVSTVYIRGESKA